ncbi:MAG: tRNA-(ms[2]io[6]A)-hydroxylase [Saprospiraceae bacterium]|nr:tRNA-(ms[2]io[6]A)-hydroxylase [Saprospiraceae bacterium]
MHQKEITKLGLHLPTDPRWVNLASYSLEEILSDHAYCEQKAASACISLIQLYPDKVELIEQVSPVVTEEWGHFRMVIAELKKRNLTFLFQRKDEYVAKLIQFQKKGMSRMERLLELLLTCALIEARSCERFRLLSLYLEEEKLKEFYHHFMVSEAGHYRMFLDLAELYFGKEKTRIRWQEYLDFEASMLKTFEPRGDRMH